MTGGQRIVLPIGRRGAAVMSSGQTGLTQSTISARRLVDYAAEVAEEIVNALDRHQTVILLMEHATHADGIGTAGIPSNESVNTECASKVWLTLVVIFNCFLWSFYALSFKKSATTFCCTFNMPVHLPTLICN